MFEGFFYLINSLVLCGGVENGNSFPSPLNAEDEAKALEDWANGDIKARDKLIHHNMRLVVHIAKKYNNHPDSDELISVGAIGLMKAVNSYNSTKGSTLATYAAKCIENEILMIMRSSKKHSKNVSLNDSIGTDKDGNDMTYQEFLASDEDDLFDIADREILKEVLQNNIKSILSQREYEIMNLRYGLMQQEPKTQKEVAKMFGISRSYVSRIESKCIIKIRKTLSKYYK